ncbi:hypothetical protein CAEBREN_04200 [Caenorhabditis brenneri]|uniref:RING-type domain-containing protein n=1 Tax=Caenorhabditis brenneri TaxID=135651 RepID=G0MWX5_CAEBE|nr:hypothetical protein CAEBREN_04200 [Caenorhabditis brenneri]
MSESTKDKENGIEVLYIPADEIQKTDNGYRIACRDGTKLPPRICSSDYFVPRINLEGNKKYYIPYYYLVLKGETTFRFLLLDVFKLIERISGIESNGSKNHAQMETISLEKFEDLLEAENIDKSLITAVNDINYTLDTDEFCKHATSPLFVEIPDREDGMFPSQAIYYVFHSVITKVNFSLNLCEDHPNCIGDFKTAVKNCCATFTVSGLDYLISKSIVQEEIKKLVKHCSFAHHLKRPKHKQIGFLIPDSPHHRFVPTTQYETTCKHYGLPNFGSCMHEDFMSIHEMRAKLMLGWIHSVFENIRSASGKLLMDVVIYLLDREQKDNIFSTDSPFLIDCQAASNESRNKVEKLTKTRHRREEKLRLKKGKPAPEKLPVSTKQISETILFNSPYLKFEVHNLPMECIEKFDELYCYTGNYPDIGKLSTIHELIMTRVCRPQYFIVNRQQAMERANEKNSMYPSTLVGYHAINNTSDYYVRSFRVRVAGVESIRILTEEALNFVFLLLVSKGLDDYDATAYQSAWSKFGGTIPLYFFEEFADKYNVNKSRIKIIEDMAYKCSVEEFRETGVAPIIFPNLRNEQVMFASQAILYVFERVVFGADFSVDYCEEHQNCLADFRQKIVEKVQDFHGTILITKYDVDRVILELQTHCSYRIQFPTHLKNLLFKMVSATEQTDLEDKKPQSALSKFRWIVPFLGTSGVVAPLIDALSMRAENIDTFYDAWRNVVNQYCENPEKPVFEPLPTEWKLVENTLPSLLAAPERSDSLIESENSSNEPEEAPEHIIASVGEEDQNPKALEPEPTSVKPKKPSKKAKIADPQKSVEEISRINAKKARRADFLESENRKLRDEIKILHGKMDEANKKRTDAVTDKNSAVKQLELYKEKAERAIGIGQRLNEAEKTLGKKDKEIQKMRKQLDTLHNRIQRTDELEEKLKRKKKNEEQLTKSKKELQDENETLKANAETMKEKLKAAQNKTSKKQKALEEELSKLKLNNKELTTKVDRLEKENEQNLTNANKKYLGIVAKASSLQSINSILSEKVTDLEMKNQNLSIPRSSRSSSTSSSSSTSINELERLKDSFENVDAPRIIENGMEMVKRLIAMKNDADTLEFAESEQMRLIYSIEEYSETLDLNIRIYKRDASKLLSLPELPALSQEFMDLFSKLDIQQTGIPDTDCVICYEFRHSHEAVIKCHRCPRIYHLKCLRKWYEEPAAGEKCPTCRVVFRDPEEYPILG